MFGTQMCSEHFVCFLCSEHRVLCSEHIYFVFRTYVSGTQSVRNTWVPNTTVFCVPNTLCSEHLCLEHKCVLCSCVPNPEHHVFFRSLLSGKESTLLG